MRILIPVLGGLVLAWATPALPAVEPIPESAQAALALRIIDAYHTPRPATAPKKLQVVYFTPADREPAAKYPQRLEPILEDIQSFYRSGMEWFGFGPKTFPLVRDSEGKLVIHLVKGQEAAEAFPRWQGRNLGNTGAPAGGDMVKRACRPVLELVVETAGDGNGNDWGLWLEPMLTR